MTPWNAVREFTAYLNSVNGLDQMEQILRIVKVGEELGEVQQAVIGWTGQNPRKGVTHSVDDVVLELADVAITAMVAIQSLGRDAEDVVEARANLIHKRAEL